MILPAVQFDYSLFVAFSKITHKVFSSTVSVWQFCERCRPEKNATKLHYKSMAFSPRNPSSYQRGQRIPITQLGICIIQPQVSHVTEFKSPNSFTDVMHCSTGNRAYTVVEKVQTEKVFPLV